MLPLRRRGGALQARRAPGRHQGGALGSERVCALRVAGAASLAPLVALRLGFERVRRTAGWGAPPLLQLLMELLL